jgi:DNA-binding NarL/FixJ family response regulator
MERLNDSNPMDAGESGPETAPDGPAPAPDETPPRLASDQGLTEREWEVLGLVATGQSNREIGATLFLARETIKSHVRSVFAKLRVRNRVEAANWYYERDERRSGPSASEQG